MTVPLTVAPRQNFKSFLDIPLALDLDALEAEGAHVAILGVPYGDPYSIDEVTNDQTNAPTAVRQASGRAGKGWERWDYDLGGTVLDGRPVKMVDCGDVSGEARDLDGHYRRAEAAVRRILAAGAMPVTIGGDHGVPIPVLRAFEGRGPITLVHLDAHLDWRDELHGAREGYSSTIRRASEMGHIEEIFQIGLRCQGSARAEEVDAALKHGCHLITASELHDRGMQAVLERIPANGNYYLTIDADGLDPAVMPAVGAPAPGGVTYNQTCKLIHGLVAKGRVVGMDIVEIMPKLDVNNITSITAGRLILNLIGTATRAGYFDYFED
ncbi:agmatinase [Ruegeria sp. HKCCD8929]|uniref:agmatinase n=1 Tax=Ruegeria sp. HKCCD8929 TaxID=2683006 RepID=UPI00148976CF|nr:agmatinase [Ruegeria sp. HKCCD8929]